MLASRISVAREDELSWKLTGYDDSDKVIAEVTMDNDDESFFAFHVALAQKNCVLTEEQMNYIQNQRRLMRTQTLAQLKSNNNEEAQRKDLDEKEALALRKRQTADYRRMELSFLEEDSVQYGAPIGDLIGRVVDNAKNGVDWIREHARREKEEDAARKRAQAEAAARSDYEKKAFA